MRKIKNAMREKHKRQYKSSGSGSGSSDQLRYQQRQSQAVCAASLDAQYDIRGVVVSHPRADVYAGEPIEGLVSSRRLLQVLHLWPFDRVPPPHQQPLHQHAFRRVLVELRRLVVHATMAAGACPSPAIIRAAGLGTCAIELKRIIEIELVISFCHPNRRKAK